MTKIVVRPVVREDLPGLLDLYQHLNPKDPKLDAAKVEAAWDALANSRGNTIFVADVSGALMASCVLSIIPNLTRGARPYAVIENVVTHAEHRRGGLGRAVMTAALDAAWDAGCYKVMLASGRDELTLRFYENIGFKRGGKTFFEMRRV